MSTTRSFSAMLNEYLPNELFKEELLRRDWILQNVEKDDNWAGGNLIVPFTGASASSVVFGSLADSTDISEFNYQRGSITTQPEVWGSLIFNHRDIMEHNKVSEQSLLKILPDQIDQFMITMKETVAQNLLNGSNFATFTADGDTGGTGYITVDHPERFNIGMKFTIDDDNSSQADVFVLSVNLNTSVIVVSDTRGGTAWATSAYTTGQNAKCYYQGLYVSGAVTNTFTSLRSSLLSVANGGTTNLYGKAKTTYPYLQAINVDGSSVSATNILDKIFDAYTTVRTLARGNASTVLMSYKHLGSVMKLIETQKGGFKVTATTQSASIYGWTEIEIVSVKGTLKIVGIQELNNDTIMLLDMTALKFYSNGFFRKRQNPDGREYFEVRATTGYSYIVDLCLFGDLVLLAPSRCGIIYSIPAY